MTVSNRRRTRKDRRERRSASARVPRLSWRTVRNPHPPTRVLSEDQVEAIHQASLRVLGDIGIKVLSPTARSLYARAGAGTDDDAEMVRFDPGMIEEYMALAPASYSIKARNASKSLTFGGNVINFALVGGPSFVSDLDRGRRAGDYEDFRNFMKLSHSFDIIHMGGAAPCAPLDLPAPTRHLACTTPQSPCTTRSGAGRCSVGTALMTRWRWRASHTRSPATSFPASQS